MKHICYLTALLPLLFHVALVAHPGARASIHYFDRLIEDNPRQQVLYIKRGVAYASDGQYDSALADFQRAAELGDPTVVSCELGIVHYRREAFDAALTAFNRYLRRFPEHTRCLEYRARVLRETGDTAASINDFQRVFALEPHPNPAHYLAVANMLQSVEPGGTEQALAVLDSGIDRLGLVPQLQRYALQLEIQRGRADLAVTRLATLQAALGNSPEWMVDMAELKLLTREYDSARELLAGAAGRLDTLRKTPARMSLRGRIATLEAVLEQRSPASPL